MTKTPENFIKAVLVIAEKFKDLPYAIRGTASLVMQGYDMNADDIDIVCDSETALKANEILADYMVKKVEYSVSDKFKSYFGAFAINGVQVEFMGEWEIKDPKGNWTPPYTASKRIPIQFEGMEVFVTPPELELEFFAKMGRWPAFHKLKKQMPTGNKGKLLIIDTFNIMHRAFHAIPSTFTEPDGTPTNAIYGVTSMIINLLETVKPQYFVAALDGAKPTFRVENFTAYKAHRKAMDEGLTVQMPKIFEVLDAFGIKQIQIDGYEADDIIGTLATELSNDVDIIIASNDRDLWQLASDHVFLLVPDKKGNLEMLGRGEVTARLGFDPDKVADYKGLRGDTSDNIPGVYGIGEVTATKLIQTYGSLEDIYRHVEEIKPDSVKEKLLNSYEQALMSKKLAQLILDTPFEVRLTDYKYNTFNIVRVKEVLEKYNFKSLIRRLGFELSAKKEREEKTDDDQLSLF